MDKRCGWWISSANLRCQEPIVDPGGWRNGQYHLPRCGLHGFRDDDRLTNAGGQSSAQSTEE